MSKPVLNQCHLVSLHFLENTIGQGSYLHPFPVPYSDTWRMAGFWRSQATDLAPAGLALRKSQSRWPQSAECGYGCDRLQRDQLGQWTKVLLRQMPPELLAARPESPSADKCSGIPFPGLRLTVLLEWLLPSLRKLEPLRHQWDDLDAKKPATVLEKLRRLFNRRGQLIRVVRHFAVGSTVTVEPQL